MVAMWGVDKSAVIASRKKTSFAPEDIQVSVDHHAAVLLAGQGMWGTKGRCVQEDPLVRAHVEGPQLTYLQFRRRKKWELAHLL